jgi:hypothetical protein
VSLFEATYGGPKPNARSPAPLWDDAGLNHERLGRRATGVRVCPLTGRFNACSARSWSRLVAGIDKRRSAARPVEQPDSAEMLKGALAESDRERNSTLLWK